MRTHHARAPFHSLRAAMVAAMIVILAAAAHVVGGGELPAPGILAAVMALTGMAATAATRLKLNFAAMAALLGTGQLVLHEAFSAFSSPAWPGQPAGTGRYLGHHTPSGQLAGLPLADLPLDAANSAATHLHQFDTVWAGLMPAGHSLATLACAFLLAKGEAALWSLAAWLRPLVQLPKPEMPDAVAAPVASGWPAASAPLPWRNLRTDSLRGPPAAVVLS